MNRFLLVHSPKGYNTYDHTSRVAGLDFDFSDIISETLKPNRDNWEQVLKVLHEYAHFYQFTCTTFGFFNSLLAFCQGILVQSFLVELAREGGHYDRPLIAEKLPVFDTSKLTTVILHLLRGLENIRLGLYGHRQFEQIGDKREAGIGAFIKAQFGIREFLFTRDGDYLPPKYRIEDVLESHAHALSTAWVIGLMRRERVDTTVIDEVVNYSMNAAKGPYREFTKFESSEDTWWDNWTYSALCDIALNPPLFNFERLPKETALHLREPNWNPSHRLYQLLLAIVERGLPTPGNQYDIEMGGDYLKQIKDRFDLDENYVATYPDSESIIVPLKTASLRMLKTNEAPSSINLMWLDSIGVFQNICRLRSISPLILSGMPRQLELLFQTVGGPNLICRSGETTGEYRRAYLGLCAAGLMEINEMIKESENIYKSSTLTQFGINRILYYRRSEEDHTVIPTDIGEYAVDTLLRLYGVNKANLT